MVWLDLFLIVIGAAWVSHSELAHADHYHKCAWASVLYILVVSNAKDILPVIIK
jgi:hypothetical protein